MVLLHAVQPLTEQETVEFRYHIRPVPHKRKEKARQELYVPISTGGGFWGFVEDILTQPQGDRFAKPMQEQLLERLAEPTMECIGRIFFTGQHNNRVLAKAASVSAVFTSYLQRNHEGIGLTTWDWQTKPTLHDFSWPEKQPSLYLTCAEMATLFKVPSDKARGIPGVQFLRFPEITIPEIVTKPAAICLGTGNTSGKPVNIYLPIRDFAQGGMTLIIGAAGSGKSVTAEHIAGDVLKLRQPKTGLVVIDPNNKLVEAIALRAVPKERLADVILLNLGDPEYPVSLPFFAKPDGVAIDTFIQTNYSLFKLIFAEQWSNTAMADGIWNMNAVLCSMPNATLLDIDPLFHDKRFRQNALRFVQDRAVLEFWREYEAMSPAEQQKLVRPIKTRMRSLYRNKGMQYILSQTSGPDYQKLLNQGKILLFATYGEALAEADSDLLCEILVAKMHLIAKSRLNNPNVTYPLTPIIIDESQHLRGVALPDLCREGRKLQMPVVAITQHVSAWKEHIYDALIGNMGTLLVMRLGKPQDARELAQLLAPFTPEQLLQQVNRHEIIAKMQANGEALPAFNFASRPPEPTADRSQLEEIIRRSRELYTRRKADVEAELLQMSSPVQGTNMSPAQEQTSEEWEDSMANWQDYDVDEA